MAATEAMGNNSEKNQKTSGEKYFITAIDVIVFMTLGFLTAMYMCQH